MSETWQPFITVDQFPAEGKAAGKIGGWYVLVVRTDAGFSALNDRCTHQAALISGGKIRRGAIMCPLHGARFDVETGQCIGGAYRDLRRFALRVTDGLIEVAVPVEQPGLDELPLLPSS